jgi:hypothetical protein
MEPREWKGGRPPGMAPTLDGAIIHWMLEHDGMAEWRDLKKVRGEGSKLTDGVLGFALKRLIKQKRIVPGMVLRKGKPKRGYYLSRGGPIIIDDGNPIPILTWISDKCTQLEASKRDKKREEGATNAKAQGEDTAKQSSICHAQGTALATGMKHIMSFVLDVILNEWLWTDNEDERNQYLDALCRIDLAVIIKELAKLADSGRGDTVRAIWNAKVQLLGEEHARAEFAYLQDLASKMSMQLPYSIPF